MLSLKTTSQSNQGLLILAAQHEGIRVDTPRYGDKAVLTKPLLEEGVIPLPCGKRSCTRKLSIDSSGSAVLQCAGHETFAGQTYWGSGCDYRAYDEYEPATCSNEVETREIAGRIALIAEYEMEEI